MYDYVKENQNYVTNKQQTNNCIIQSHRIGSTNPSTIPVTLGGLKPTVHRRSTAARVQRNTQLTSNLWFNRPRLKHSQLKPNPKINLHINLINLRIPLFIEIQTLITVKRHHFRTLKRRAQRVSCFVSLIKRTKKNRVNSSIMVQSPSFDVIVVDTKSFVRVADCHVEREIIVEVVVVVCVVELREGSFGDVDFDYVGTNYEPEEEDGDSDEYYDGED